MDVRLVQLLGSFVGARSRYVLARLEFAMHHPDEPAPPLVDHLAEPYERAVREAWPQIESQLEAARAFAEGFERSKRRRFAIDGGYRLLQRSLRELDQSARAIRWLLTVTESTNYDL